MISCTSCGLTLYSGILNFHENDTAAMEFLQPTRCRSYCTAHHAIQLLSLAMGQTCSSAETLFVIADRMELNADIPSLYINPLSWSTVIYLRGRFFLSVNHFLMEWWSHKSIMKNSNTSLLTAIDLRSFRSFVVEITKSRLADLVLQMKMTKLFFMENRSAECLLRQFDFSVASNSKQRKHFWFLYSQNEEKRKGIILLPLFL